MEKNTKNNVEDYITTLNPTNSVPSSTPVESTSAEPNKTGLTIKNCATRLQDPTRLTRHTSTDWQLSTSCPQDQELDSSRNPMDTQSIANSDEETLYPTNSVTSSMSFQSNSAKPRVTLKSFAKIEHNLTHLVGLPTSPDLQPSSTPFSQDQKPGNSWNPMDTQSIGNSDEATLYPTNSVTSSMSFQSNSAKPRVTLKSFAKIEHNLTRLVGLPTSPDLQPSSTPFSHDQKPSNSWNPMDTQSLAESDKTTLYSIPIQSASTEPNKTRLSIKRSATTKPNLTSLIQSQTSTDLQPGSTSFSQDQKPGCSRNPLSSGSNEAIESPSRSSNVAIQPQSEGPTELAINGITVKFPVQPYPGQIYITNQVMSAMKAAMSCLVESPKTRERLWLYSNLNYQIQVINAFRTAQSCLVDSPTGTGKTMALLCSSLAFGSGYDANIAETMDEDEINEDNTFFNEGEPPEPEDCINEDSKNDEEPKDSRNDEKPQKENDEEENEEEENEQKQNEEQSNTMNPILQQAEEQREIPATKAAPRYRSPPRKIKEEVITLDSDNDSDEGVFQIPKRKLKNGENDEIQKNPPKKVKAFSEPEIEEAALPPTIMRGTKIFYATRTHKQLEQVISQFKKTPYAGTVRMTVLSSRRQTCVNEDVLQSGNITEGCHNLLDPVEGSGCIYYDRVREYSDHKTLERSGLPKVFDIEDLHKMNKPPKKFCPYYTLRNLEPKSEIVFCPYNYLLDTRIRESMQINISRAIVILDEGHNVEQICRDMGSFWLKQDELEAAIKSCYEHKRMGQEGFDPILKYLEELLHMLTSHGNDFAYSSNNEAIVGLLGQDLVNTFINKGVSMDDFKEFKESLEAIKKRNNQDNPEESSIIGGILKICCDGIETVLNYLFNHQHVEKYNAYFTRKETAVEGASQCPNQYKYNMHLMCCSGDVVFSELRAARSVVLASGSFTPISSTQSELGSTFRFTVKGKHVINQNNVFAYCLPKGPKGVSLNGVFSNTATYEYQEEIGFAILETIKNTPNGVLVFVQSYVLLNKLKARWLATGLLNDMNRVKKVFWEPQGGENLDVMMAQYTKLAGEPAKQPKQSGAIIFAVHRGKLSEGMDFSDNLARAVILVGIPYLNCFKMDVKLKMHYNSISKSLLNGNKWYKVQAYRAMNQALGRCIRHKADWGAIILMDPRFLEEELNSHLPTWMNKKVQKCSDWKQYINDLKNFFSVMMGSDKPHIDNHH